MTSSIRSLVCLHNAPYRKTGDGLHLFRFASTFPRTGCHQKLFLTRRKPWTGSSRKAVDGQQSVYRFPRAESGQNPSFPLGVSGQVPVCRFRNSLRRVRENPVPNRKRPHKRSFSSAVRGHPRSPLPLLCRAWAEVHPGTRSRSAAETHPWSRTGSAGPVLPCARPRQ